MSSVEIPPSIEQLASDYIKAKVDACVLQSLANGFAARGEEANESREAKALREPRTLAAQRVMELERRITQWANEEALRVREEVGAELVERFGGRR